MANELSSPVLYPIGLDATAGQVLFARMSEADYTAASFLDARMNLPPDRMGWLPWAEVQSAAAAMPVKCHFLFHISHVGSTLLARLLGEHPAFFVLREPVLFRKLAETPDPDRLRTFLALWSRTFRPEQTSLIKATSFVSELAADLIVQQPEAKAIAMYLSPRRFLLALLDGAMSDIISLGPARQARLNRRLPGWSEDVAMLSPGEQVMMSWLTEMLALAAAANAAPNRILWLDFDRVLKNPLVAVKASLRHLDVAAEDIWIQSLVAGPIMSRYAKAPEASFDAAFRERLLQQCEARHAGEITRGLAWLERMADAYPPVRHLLNAGL